MLSKLEARFPILINLKVLFQQTFAIFEADVRKLRHDPF